VTTITIPHLREIMARMDRLPSTPQGQCIVVRKTTQVGMTECPGSWMVLRNVGAAVRAALDVTPVTGPGLSDHLP
jgi:hypothetical protein